MEKMSEDCIEKFSKILLLEKSRINSDLEFEAAVGKRKFARFDEIFTQSDTFLNLLQASSQS